MKDICILEVSPSGPIENHVNIFEKYDWYYVTHDKPLEYDKKCIKFNKGCRWAYNRNYLYDYVKTLKTKYRYYLFIDYDVEIKSNTNRNVMNQLIHDLNEYNPAIMVINDKTKNDYKNNPDTGVYNFLFSNNHLKIYHYTVLDHFFYLPTFEGCLQLWDACHFNNVNEIPFMKYSLCTSNLTCKGLISGKDSNPKDSKERDELFFAKMQEIHELMMNNFTDKLIEFKTHRDIKNHFLNLSKTFTPVKMTQDVNYKDIINVKEFFKPYDMRKKQYNDIVDKIPDIKTDPLKYVFEVMKLKHKPNTVWAEFGVWKGKTVNYISKFTKKNVYGFDSFEGLPETWYKPHQKGSFDTEGKLPKVNFNVKLIKGWFSDTILPFKEKLIQSNQKISFLHIDGDLYSSAKCVLDNLKDMLDKDCVIVFDELVNWPEWDENNGELRAWYEFTNENKVDYDWIGVNGKGRGMLNVKPRYPHENVALIIHSIN